jgi:2-polyprenyl-6-methoxyphenol hydroxylase-like FAD-dependent oxidoreductase
MRTVQSKYALRNRRVLISGAGIAGPTLAWWLVRKGFVPTLVEQARAPRTGGYLIDFWGVGYDVAERMGLLPTLRSVGYEMKAVRIVDELGRGIAGFDADTFRAATAGRYLSVMRGDLAHTIYESVASDVDVRFGDSVRAIQQDDEGVTVLFEHQAPRRFDLVVGAGGLHSVIRALAFGPESQFEKYLGYYTAAFSASHYPHRDEGVYVSYTVPGRQLARYSLRDDRTAFFLILAADHALANLRHDVEAQRATLHEAFGGLGWELGEIVAAMDSADDLYFDAVAQARLPHWSRDRVVLLGDAAYCPSLLAGQGSAFAMAGAYVLAHELAAAGGDHRRAFVAYERRFKPFMDAKQRSAERFGGWFAPRTKRSLRLRNLATRAMNLPWLGEWLVSRSLGDRFDLDG